MINRLELLYFCYLCFFTNDVEFDRCKIIFFDSVDY